jgi:putative membrane protein
MRQFPISILFLLVALTSVACRERETVPDLSGTTTVHRDVDRSDPGETGTLLPPVDRNQFVAEALTGGLSEAELGQLARERGDSSDVRQFGDRMVAYYGEASKRMLLILRDQQIEASSDVSDEQRTNATRLGRLEGPEFDRQYIQQVIENHQKSTELYRRASESDINPELRQFATESLPDLEDHFERALAIQGELRSARAGMSREAE